MRRLSLIFSSILFSILVFSQLSSSHSNKSGSFPLIKNHKVPDILIDKNDAKVVEIAATLLAGDMEMVAGEKPRILTTLDKNQTLLIIAGTINQSDLIKKLVDSKKISLSQVSGKWESWQTQIVDKPFAGISKALVIVGSDRRGTAYGLLELSRTMGVSPWVWWADVTPERKNNLFITSNAKVSKEPSVKYRGIFLNDEDWGLQPWAAKHFDTDIKDIGPKSYAKIFELMLRLRSNYIWPAMHPCTKAFYYYPENPKVADDYAVVVGSSHCEPILRNNVFEWAENYKHEYGVEPGEWRYDLNQNEIYNYWNDRAKQSADYESIYTVGMRGVHDGRMPGPKDTGLKIKLLEEIITDQRELLANNLKLDSAKIPQIFCPYKEVLDLYQRGLDLPEDITIVWADDNHGYIRQLSNTDEQKRSGGSGIYYHLSYWGSPHDYLWLSTISPSLIAYEMNKAYQFGAKNVWVFNVGDIKPAEMEIEFAMDMAWDVDKWTPENAHRYAADWALRTFGRKFAKQIAQIKETYFDLSQAAKPEHLTKVQFSSEQETERLKQYQEIATLAERLKLKIPARLQDAYFQLVWYPVQGAKLMNQKFVYARQSLNLAKAKNPEALIIAQKAKDAYSEIQTITKIYNEQIANGKWDKMMSAHPRKLEVFNMPEVATEKMLTDAITKNETQAENVKSEIFLSLKNEGKIQSTSSESLVAYQGLGKSGFGVTRKSFTGKTYLTYCAEAPYIEFNVENKGGSATVAVYALPTQPLTAKGGVRYAISVNDSAPEIIDLKSAAETPNWKENVVYGYAKAETTHALNADKNMNIKIYLIEPGVVINQISVSRIEK